MALQLRLNYENYMHLLAYAPMPVMIHLTKGSDYSITCHILGKNMEWEKKKRKLAVRILKNPCHFNDQKSKVFRFYVISLFRASCF